MRFMLPHLRSGRLKGLAMGTLKRSPLLPELPTLDELGISGYDAANWYAIATATGTPPAIVKRLHTEIANYLRQPETRIRITAMGADNVSRFSCTEIAPDLAPAIGAIRVLHAHDHRRTIVHRTERGDDRRSQRVAENVRLDAADDRHRC